MEKELDNIPKEEWAKIWCSLNAWDIPEQLKHLTPTWWGGKERDRKWEFMKPVMEKIVSEIGKKIINREWNRKNMTDEEHEAFWNSEDNFSK